MIAGGGTAGHVVPALAIADVLEEKGFEVHFCGGPQGMERELVPKAGYPFHPVRIRGFERRLGLGTLRTILSLPVAAWDAWRALRRVRPACVIGVGAYASGPVVAEAAVLRRIPSLAVEMDAHLGWTNRILSLLVDRVCLSFPGAHEEGGKFVFTGRPVRPELLRAIPEEGRARFGVEDGLPVLLVFGGSLGAPTINREAFAAFSAEHTPYAVLHVTGSRNFEALEERHRRENRNPRYRIYPYLDDFASALAAADVAVARAGGSVAELLARGIPSVLVPFPLATADHQTKNARMLEEEGAAVVIPDRELTSKRLASAVAELLEPTVHRRMSDAALALARPDAATRIAEQVVQLAGAPRA